MKIIQGVAVETLFKRAENDGVYAVSSREMPEGEIAATQDMDIHQMSNLQGEKADLITLHVYSPPLLVMGQYSLTDPVVGKFEDPVYEFQPVGRVLRGRAGVERYYRHLMEHFLPNVESAEIVDEWCNENSLTQEYDVTIRVDGGEERHRVTGILVVGEEKLLGERIYGSERMLRLMLGDLYDELEAL